MQDLSTYPAASWRPNQQTYAQMVRAVAASPGEKRVGLEGPCGSGKSIGYLRGLLDPAAEPSLVLSTTRQHLQQIEDTLQTHWPGGDWAVLRGRSHYGCCVGQKDAQKVKRQAAEAELEDDRDPADEWAKPSKCPLGEKCFYRKAIMRCAKAKVVVQCTIGALYRQQYWGELQDPAEIREVDDPEYDTDNARATHAECLRNNEEWNRNRNAQIQYNEARRAVINRKVVVLDEAHEYLSVRRSFETQEVRIFPREFNQEFVAALEQARMKGRYKCSYVLLSEDENRGLAEHMVKEYQAQLSDQWLESKKPKRAFAPGKWEEVKNTLKEKTRRRIGMLEAGLGLGEGDPRFRPVVTVQWERSQRGGDIVKLVSEPLYAGVGAKIAEREVFTSATMSGVAPLLRIEPRWLKCFPEIFNWAANVTPNPIPDPNPGVRTNLPIPAGVMEQLYSAPGRPLTVVLFISRRHTKEATEHIARRPGVFVQGDHGDLSECIEKVKAYQGPVAPMLVSYGGWVGTDLPGNKWLVLGSATKSPLGPHHEARALRGLTRSAWNDREKSALDRLQLAQGLGRALRTMTDRAVVIWPATQAFGELGLQPNARLR